MKNDAKKWALAALVAGVVPLAAAAADPGPAGSPTPNGARYAEARGALDRARGGDAAAAARAADLFHELSQQEPANPIYVVYEGSSNALRGGAASAPWEKMKLTEHGLDLLDRALAMLAPGDGRPDLGATPIGLEVRLVAASTFLALPELFHRFEDGKAVVEAAVGSPSFERAPPPLRAQLQLLAATIARREGRRPDEARALHAAVAALPQGPAADKARARLAEVER